MIARVFVAGALAGLFLGGLDAAVSAPPLLPQFTSASAWLEFTLRLSLLPLLPLLLWSGVLAGLSYGLSRVATAVTRREMAAPASQALYAWLFGLAAVPYVAWVCSQLFAGSRAQRLPGRQLLAVLAGGLAVAGVRAAVPAVAAVQRWVSGAALRGLFAATLGLLLSAACYVLDRSVLPRLYLWFHLSLEILAVLSSQAAAAFAMSALVRSHRADLAQPATAATATARRRLAGLALLLVAGALLSGSALVRLHRATVLRGLMLEQTTLGSRILGPYAAFRARGTAKSAVPLPSAAPERDETPPPLYSGPRLDGRDVFLITVDALRHDRLRSETMPFTSGLGRRGVSFSRAYTQVPHTSFAVATLLTGKPVYALMALGHEAASHETLPTILRRFRYKTAAFYPPAVFYVERERLKRLEESAYGFEYVKYEYMSAPGRTDQVMAFLEAEHPPRVFVWVHYFEPHEPYEVHDLADGRGPGPGASDRDRYDGEVRFVDREIERLVKYLERTRPGSLVIVAADHGEEFSEHGGRYHGTALYEEQVRVPLVLAELTATPLLRPRTLQQPVGLIDLTPTLLGLLDIERSLRMRGRDLSPWLLTGAAELPEEPVYAEIDRKKMVVSGTKKLICDLAVDTCQSFDLLADPGERHNLIDADPEGTRRLRGLLDRFIDEARRYEVPAGPRLPGAAAAALDRARLGDRGALPQLAALLAQKGRPLAERRQVLSGLAALLASVPPPTSGAPDALSAEPELFTAATRALLDELLETAEGSPDMGAEAARRWAAVALVRLFGPELRAADLSVRTLVALLEDASTDARQRLFGSLALFALPACRPGQPQPAVDCVKLWLTVLPAAMELEDPDAVRPLLALLGKSRDARALEPLLRQLVRVRSRSDVVQALGSLADPGAVSALAALLSSDPYVHVRAAAAMALGSLGGKAARAALLAAAKTEREAPVTAAIKAALSQPAP